MKHSAQTPSTKQNVTVAVSEELLLAAKRRNIDLSAALESYLCRELGQENGPDFCETYAAELSNRQKDTENFKEYGRAHGLF